MNVLGRLKRMFHRSDPEAHEIRNQMAVAQGRSERVSKRVDEIEREARRRTLQLQLEVMQRHNPHQR